MNNKTVYNTYGSLSKPRFSLPKIGKKFKIAFVATLFAFLVVGVFVVVFIGYPVYRLKDQTYALKDNTYLIKNALSNKDLADAQEKLEKTKDQIILFEKSYEDAFRIISKIPAIKPYYNDGRHALNAGKLATDIGSELLITLSPFSSQLGFMGDENSQSIDNKTRIFNLIKLMPEISPQISATLGKISEVDKEMSYIDESRYPASFRGVKIRSSISEAKSLLHEVSAKAPTFDSLFSLIPEIMGLSTPKTYLILMANNYELRMSGGFNTYLVLVKMDKGVPSVIMSLDTYDIDKDKSYLVYRNVPSHLRDYLLVNRFYARDATSNSPDFKVALDEFLAKFWKVDYSMPQKFDGVIQVNNNVVENLLRVVGPVTATGYSVKTDQGTYINVPKQEFTSETVISQLEKIAGGSLAETIGRKDIIRYLMLSIMDKALNTPTENLGNLVQTLFNDLNQKNILLHFFNPEQQLSIESLGYGGTLVPIPNGYDYFHVNNSNYGSGKRDWLIGREVWKETEVIDGKLVSTVKMKTINPTSPDWWQWIKFYRDYFRIYVPLGSKLISATSSDAQDLKAKTIEDLGKTAIEGFFKLDEGADNTITIKYELPSTVNIDNYKLMIQKQSGVKSVGYTIGYKGVSKSFDLITDKEMSF
jgi:hypothetical protein